MRASTYFPRRQWLLGLGLLAAAPLAAQTPILTNNGGTLYVAPGGTLHVNGSLRQTGAALLRTAGTATVAGNLNTAGTLDLNAGLLSVAGNITNSASLASTTGTLRFYGSANQTLNLNGRTVPNLTVDKPAGTATLGSGLRVRRVLTMAGAGDLNTNGQQLTLVSNSVGTALVVNSGTGVVTGNTARVERYIDGSLNASAGYRHLAPPVSGASVFHLNEGSSGIPTTNPAYNTAAQPGLVTPFPTVFGYDQSRLVSAANSNLPAFDKGWYSPASEFDAITPGQGYTVQLLGNGTAAFRGTPGTGTYTLNLARNAGATAPDAGWHLVGNPYPAPIDWSLVQPADRAGLDAAMYVWESTSQYGGQYRSYTNGIGGGAPLIGSSQGFFVRVSSGNTSGTLTFRNQQRLTDYDAAQVLVRRAAADPRPQLQLTLAGAGLTDRFDLYAQAGATPGLDSEYDAAKLTNPHGLNLASLTAAGEQLAIDGRTDFATATAIPLQVGVPAAGRYTFTAAALANLPAGTRAELVDNLTGTRTLLMPGATYAFTMTAYTAPGRFWLNLTPAAAPLTTAAALETQVVAYPNPAHGQLTVLRPAAQAATAELLNSLGQRVISLRLPTAETAVDLHGLAAGVYTLRLTLDGQPVTKRVVVE